MLVLSTRWVTMVSCSKRETKKTHLKPKLQKKFQTHFQVTWNARSKCVSNTHLAWFDEQTELQNSYYRRLLPSSTHSSCPQTQQCHWLQQAVVPAVKTAAQHEPRLWFQTTFKRAEMWFSRGVWWRVYTDGIFQMSHKPVFFSPVRRKTVSLMVK